MFKRIQRKIQLGLQISALLLAGFAILYFSENDSVVPGKVSPKTQQAQASIGTLTINNPAKTEPGFTLYPVDGNGEIHLLNMQGETVHKWQFDGQRARLLPNCNLLVKSGTNWGKDNPKWKSMRNQLVELNWQGDQVWQYTADDNIHHDFRILPDNSVIFLKRQILPESYKEKIHDISKRSLSIISDSILQVNRAGEITWRWNAHDFLDLNSCGRRPCLDRVGEDTGSRNLADWTHLNTVSIIPENKWYRQGDQRFKPGNLLTLPRNFWTVYLIDKDSGEVVWDYGGDYKGGISGGHEAQMIPEGYPGAGNIIIIDNGSSVHYGESYILEINPQTKELVWVYDQGNKFWTKARGSVQRLKNGNTLISEDLSGRVFEVSADKETVWEFKGSMISSRAEKYSPDYCQEFKKLKLQ